MLKNVIFVICMIPMFFSCSNNLQKDIDSYNALVESLMYQATTGYHDNESEKGAIMATRHSLDFYILGASYFKVQNPETGEIGFSKNGHFTKNPIDHQIYNGEGFLLLPRFAGETDASQLILRNDATLYSASGEAFYTIELFDIASPTRVSGTFYHSDQVERNKTDKVRQFLLELPTLDPILLLTKALEMLNGIELSHLPAGKAKKVVIEELLQYLMNQSFQNTQKNEWERRMEIQVVLDRYLEVLKL